MNGFQGHTPSAVAKFAPAVIAIMNRENVDQRTEEWYRRRKGLLTASDVATALEMNPYKRRSALLKEKACPEERKNSSSVATEHGNKYEDEAIELYEEMTGRKALRFGLFVSEVYQWLGGSPDGVTTDGVLLEVKCPLSRAIKDEVPPWYMPQLQVLMEILDLVSPFRPAACSQSQRGSHRWRSSRSQGKGSTLSGS